MKTSLGNRRLRMTVTATYLPVFLIILLCLQNARATLLFYEGFDYPAGVKLGQAASANTWENYKDQIMIASGSLDYPGLEKSTGNHVNFKPATPSLDGVRTVDGAWDEQSEGTLYVSFILRLQSFSGIESTGSGPLHTSKHGTDIGLPDNESAGAGTPLLTIGHASNSSQLLGINLLKDGKVRLGVIKYPSNGGMISSSAFFTNGPGADLTASMSATYLVVAKYEWKKGETNDEVTLWVNPTNLGGGEDPGHKVSTSAGPDGTKSARRLTLCRGADVSIDELRIGQTWAEVTPVARPSHQLMMVGALTCGLVAAGFWIAQLRRKVKERSIALRAQIQERQKAEHQRLMEQERARIAHDLHDELGGDITEIGMLATRARGNVGGGEEGQRCLEQLAGKTRQMVAKLEEIVWAMDPQYDSLGALVSYFSFFADRFLGLANIKLTIDSSEDAASLAVEARMRHQLFLVFKESLANVVKHSGASEVRLTVRVENRTLQVVVADNGRGFQEPDSKSGTHEGTVTMRTRVERLGGQFEIAGETGRGTTVKFSVPLDS